MINKITINPNEYDIKLVYAKGKNVEQIAKEHNADIAINFSYVDYTNTGTIYGNTVAEGKKLFGDFEKVSKRVGLGINSKPYIGQLQEGSSSYSKAGPLLVSNGKDVREQQIKEEQIPSDIAYSDTERIGIGLKGDLLTILYGKATLPELTQKALEEGLDTFINGDGGGSATVYMNGKVINKSGYLRPVCHAWVFVKKSVLIINDGGHGGTDPGAQSNGQKEKEWTLEASLYVNDRLNEHGILSTVTRDKDITLDSTPRTKLVRDSGAKYCLSHHFNAYNGKASGAEFIHSIYANGKFEEMLKSEFDKVGMPTRRVFTRKLSNGKDYYYMHRETGAVRTTIIEYGFLDNENDFNFLKVKENRIKLYEAVVKTVCNEQNIPYKPISNSEDINTLKEKIKGLESNINTLIKDNEQLKRENGQCKEKITKIKTLLN